MAAMRDAPKRARKVPAPELTFEGRVAAPDYRGHIQVLLIEEDLVSWGVVVRGVPEVPRDGKAPYTLYRRGEPDDSGVRGVVLLAPPKDHQRYWMEEAERLRGAMVKIAARPRRYNFAGRSGRQVGVALDLTWMEELKREV